MNKQDFLNLISPYDAIIFDFGGIFIDIDYSLTTQALTELSQLEDASSFYTKKNQHSFFDDFETGKITAEIFIAILREALKIDAPDEKIISAWNAMLLGIPKERFEFIQELKQKKKIYLLSNINEIHENYLQKYINETPELTGFYESFHGVYFSHLIGHRKPNKEAFEWVLDKHNLKKEKTLFIDDSPQHIEGAKNIGLNTYYLNPANTFIKSRT